MDLVSLARCIINVYGNDAYVSAVRKTTALIPSGAKVWSSLRVNVAVTGCIAVDTFEMVRLMRDDGGTTPAKQHVCMLHNGLGDLNAQACDVAAMVAMCEWKNLDVKQHPEVWKYFRPQRRQWCEARDSPFVGAWYALLLHRLNVWYNRSSLSGSHDGRGDRGCSAERQ